jgi:hypothetical protein
MLRTGRDFQKAIDDGRCGAAAGLLGQALTLQYEKI